MEVATRTTEATLTAIHESLAKLTVSLGRIAERQDKMLVDMKKTTAALMPIASATPLFIPDRVLEKQKATKPSSPSIISAHRVVASAALNTGMVLASSAPIRCSTIGSTANVSSNHAVVASPSLGNMEAAVLTPLDPLLDMPLKLYGDLEFNRLTPTTCSVQCFHDGTSVETFVSMSAASSSSSQTPFLLDGADFSPTPSVTAVPEGVKVSSTATPHMVDRMADEMLTDVGGISLFRELDLYSASEVFNDNPLKDVVWDEDLAGCLVTHSGSSPSFLEHVMGTNEEFEGKVNKGTCLDIAVCLVGLVSLIEVKLQQLWSRERKQYDTNTPTLLLPWYRGKQEVVVHDLCLQLPHAEKGIMPTLPSDPGAYCSLQSVAYMLVLIRNGDVLLGRTSLWPTQEKMFASAHMVESYGWRPPEFLLVVHGLEYNIFQLIDTHEDVKVAQNMQFLTAICRFRFSPRRTMVSDCWPIGGQNGSLHGLLGPTLSLTEDKKMHNRCSLILPWDPVTHVDIIHDPICWPPYANNSVKLSFPWDPGKQDELFTDPTGCIQLVILRTQMKHKNTIVADSVEARRGVALCLQLRIFRASMLGVKISV